MRIAMLVALGGLLLLACGVEPEEPERRSWADVVQLQPAGSDEADRPASNGIPVVRSVRIDPAEPFPGDRVRAVVDVERSDGNRFALRFTWELDGELLERGASSIDLPDDMRAGDVIEVTVVAGDGIAESEPKRATATVANQRPRLLGISITPAGVIIPGETIVVTPEAVDPDGDELEYDYSWTVNGEAQVIDFWDPQDHFSTAGLRQGDRIEVTVVARDRRGAQSRPLASGAIDLRAAAPEILSAPAGYDGGTFRYSLEARDPQGGRLRFSLRKGPEGMRVDPDRGEVFWSPAPNQTGIHPVEIVVENSGGIRAIQAFELEVSMGAAKLSP